jgi:uncharacterized membrane protein YkoI
MKIVFGSICAALILLAAPAWADISRDGAAAVSQRVASGLVLSVEKAESGGLPVWRVKVLTGQGEVRVILVDVATGQAQ